MLHPTIDRCRGCLHVLALPGCNEAWDRFDVLKIEISCVHALAKLFRSEYFKVIYHKRQLISLSNFVKLYDLMNILMLVHDGCFNFSRQRIDLFQYIKMLSRFVASRKAGSCKQPLRSRTQTSKTAWKWRDIPKHGHITHFHVVFDVRVFDLNLSNTGWCWTNM